MTINLEDTAATSVKHYLHQISLLLAKLSDAENKVALLETRIAPDAFSTDLNFAIAIQFAARALCPPSGKEVPEIPEDLSCSHLQNFCNSVTTLIDPITLVNAKPRVSHVAGDASLTQDSPDYVLRFALPNMIFHFTMAYAGLRQGGMDIGKADFDGLHVY